MRPQAAGQGMRSSGSSSIPEVQELSTIQSVKDRQPHCQRCAQHNLQSRLKGHKANCPYIQCQCAKCQVVVERQRLMADQIKLRRRQKKMRAMRSASDPSTVSTSNAQSLQAHSEKDYDARSINRFANSAALPPISAGPPLEATPLPAFSQLFSALEFQRQALQHNLALFGRIPMNI